MIVEFINEIKGQVSILKSYYEDLKRSEYFGILNQKENESYFFGLGDSYAASIAVSELTGCVYGEPYEWQYKKLPFGKNFIFISVSGKTNANINLAKKAKELKNRIIAITGNRDSELAKIADLVIDMNYKEKIILPGTLSFTKSLVASFSLFGIDLDFEIIKREYEKSRKKDLAILVMDLCLYWHHHYYIL
jgi:Glucosamine 6-phosphate synthetase, contains amidotransferase and phosphosugar isomerase domains